MPVNLALLLLGTGLGVIAAAFVARWSLWWSAAAVALLPLGLLLPYGEVRLLEYRIRTNFPEFQRALPIVLLADKMGCSDSAYVARRLQECTLYDSLPHKVRALVSSVRVLQTTPAPRVLFQFRRGSRQILLYDPSVSEPHHRPCRPLGAGWHLHLG